MDLSTEVLAKSARTFVIAAFDLARPDHHHFLDCLTVESSKDSIIAALKYGLRTTMDFRFASQGLQMRIY